MAPNYGRGVAYAAKGDAANAKIALDTVIAINKATADDNQFKAPTAIAMHALMGEIAARGGNAAASIPHFQEPLNIESKGLYFEPPK